MRWRDAGRWWTVLARRWGDDGLALLRLAGYAVLGQGIGQWNDDELALVVDCRKLTPEGRRLVRRLVAELGGG